MVLEVSHAIKAGRPVLVGETDENDSYRAIFVPESGMRLLPQSVFTSWYNSEDKRFQNPGEKITKHASLEVDVDECDAGVPSAPRLRTRRWINGLCFFDRSAKREVIFPWPDTFQ